MPSRVFAALSSSNCKRRPSRSSAYDDDGGGGAAAISAADLRGVRSSPLASEWRWIAGSKELGKSWEENEGRDICHQTLLNNNHLLTIGKPRMMMFE